MAPNQKIALSIIVAVSIMGILTLVAGYLMISMAWRDYEDHGHVTPETSKMTLFGRAFARKCPVCGKGALARNVFQMNQHCPSCNVLFWTNDGEFMGPVIINYAAAMAAALGSWAVLMFFDFGVTAQTIVPCLAALTSAIGMMPWSRSFWTLFLYLSGEIEPAPEGVSSTPEPGA